jgi:predicted ribosomally synthesized peptide with nif11-like leader
LVYYVDSFYDKFLQYPMSKAEEFLDAIATNPQLRAAITTTTTAAEAVKIAADAGIEISEEDLLTAFKSRMSELSDEDLQGVAGGKLVSCLDNPADKNITLNETGHKIYD